MRLGPWLPPLVWMAFILWMSSDTGSAARTSRYLVPLLQALFPSASPGQIDALHGLVRKLGHVTEYAVLTALWVRALAGKGSRAAAWSAFALAATWAVVDESYQSTVRTRTGSPFDVGIDVFGALLVAVPAGYGWRPTAERLTATLLWLAAVGGLAILALDLAAGVAPGALWLTVPLAVVALALLRRRRATPPTP
jgi:VanZ family protein